MPLLNTRVSRTRWPTREQSERDDLSLVASLDKASNEQPERVAARRSRLEHLGKGASRPGDIRERDNLLVAVQAAVSAANASRCCLASIAASSSAMRPRLTSPWQSSQCA